VDRIIQISDVASGKLLKTLRGHDFPIWSLAFGNQHPNWLIAAGEGGEMKAWDISTEQSWDVAGHSRQTSILCLEFSPDDTHLASAGGRWGDFGVTQVWRIPELSRIIPAREAWVHDDLVYGLAWCPTDHNLLAAGDRSAWTTMWNIQSESDPITCSRQLWFVADVVFSPDGNRLLTGSPSGFITFWTADEGQRRGTLQVPDQVRRLDFLDPQTIVVAGSQGTVRLIRTKADR
jgi:WD40 repeat protein